MHVTKVFRNKKPFSMENMNIDETLVPSQLVDIINSVPDSDTSEYFFVVNKRKNIPTENLEYISQFPKNYLLSHFQQVFKRLSELEKSVSDKDDIILGLENSLKELTSVEKISLKKKDDVILGLENSLKEQKSYTESIISEKDTIIEGHENSIQEQSDYIKNLEEHIHQLESKLSGFKFWKK